MHAKRLYMYLFLIAAFAWSPCYGDWKSDANARIESIRKRNAEITVVDSNGDPISGVNVLIEQIGHRFAFGTCITRGQLENDSYKDSILDHFEWAVCENETKWPSNEPQKDNVGYESADDIYTWCNSNGIKMRGHCLFWEQDNQVQKWVKDLTYATYPADSNLLTEVDQRIDSAVNHYKNKFHNWDVDNEMLNNSFYDRLGEAGRVHMFQRANQVDPNCGMFMNEYNGNSWVPWAYDSGPYVTRATNLINMGAPIHGLGIQGHLGSTSSFDPARYYSDTLQPLAALNRPIWATEFDVNQPSDTTRANIMEDFYRICFSHPSVEGILMWGFRQGITWQKDWWIVNSDWTLNAAGIRYEDLMEEWTTNDSGTTDGWGRVSFRGFHGTYKITLSKTDQPTEIYTIELEPGETTAQFVLRRYISNVGILGSWVTGAHAKQPGTDRALVFIAHAERNTTSAPNLTSVTYGGQAMTKVVDKAVSSGSTRTYVAAFILNDAGITAATNSTFSRVWSPSPSNSAYASVFLSNVNQSALTGATASDEITTGTTITTPWLATSAGDMVIDAATSSNTGTYTTNNGFTKAIDFSDPNYTGVDGYKTANGDSEIPSVTHSTFASRQSAIGFVVQAADKWLYGDLTHDNKVDVNDLSEFCKVWLVPDCDNNNILELDLNGDCVIDFYEYSLFAQNWLRKLE